MNKEQKKEDIELHNEWMCLPWSDPESADNRCEWCNRKRPDVKPRLDPTDIHDSRERMLCDRCDGYQYEQRETQ
jgi:hypothetical protein